MKMTNQRYFTHTRSRKECEAGEETRESHTFPESSEERTHADSVQRFRKCLEKEVHAPFETAQFECYICAEYCRIYHDVWHSSDDRDDDSGQRSCLLNADVFLRHFVDAEPDTVNEQKETDWQCCWRYDRFIVVMNFEKCINTRHERVLKIICVDLMLFLLGRINMVGLKRPNDIENINESNFNFLL